jgi:signal transduction histidine kinase
MTEPADIRSAYKSELDGSWRRLSRISALVALVLVPAGIVLDRSFYPRMIEPFFQLRVAADILIFLCLLTYSTPFGKHYVREVTFLWLVLIQMMICYMIFLTDGARSPYYAGLNLSVLAVGIFLPTNLFETLFFVVVTLTLYVGTVLASDITGPETGFAYGNFFFLCLTSVVTLFASYVGDRSRFESYESNLRLKEYNKRLEDLDRTKSQFFANISHELRTPLTLILSPIQDLLESHSGIPEKVAFALGTIKGNALRLLKLVNDLLDIIRLEEGKLELEITPVAMDQLIAGISDSMGYLAEIQEIDFRSSLNAGNAVVSGDASALEKIFINVLNNAIKFCKKGGMVEVTTRLRDGEYIAQIADTGIGIPKDQLPYIFNRFHQVDGSSTRRYGGTGLGLALVKELVERHAGRIAVDSEVGKGTVLTIWLPADKGEIGDVAEPSVETRPDIGIQRLHRLAEINTGMTVSADDTRDESWEETTPAKDLPRVLIVDDESDMRRYLVSTMRGIYDIFQADDGEVGLKRAQEILPDLMVLDLMLPRVDGLEICRTLKANDTTRAIKIVLLTARVDEDAKLTALQNGADDFVTKPFSRVELLSRLANLLQTSRLEKDLRKSNDELKVALSDLKATQAQLIQSEKLNALGSLAAGLLHEINNPLNYSLTALQLLRSDEHLNKDELLSEVCSDIDEGMQRIRSIVSDLHAFAYPSEADKSKSFRLIDAVESASRFTAHELRSVDFDVNVSPDILVVGSKTHVTQVLVNLFINSAKATREVEDLRRGEIQVTGKREDGRVVVRVVDNGIGMEEKTISRIFDPFFTTRDVGEGMGLGLSICHTIIANHGGKLIAKSGVGKGTELAFDLALAEEQFADVPQELDVDSSTRLKNAIRLGG